eukprot:690464-Pelagomonas_calceolata.AAC.1
MLANRECTKSTYCNSGNVSGHSSSYAYKGSPILQTHTNTNAPSCSVLMREGSFPPASNVAATPSPTKHAGQRKHPPAYLTSSPCFRVCVCA